MQKGLNKWKAAGYDQITGEIMESMGQRGSELLTQSVGRSQSAIRLENY